MLVVSGKTPVRIDGAKTWPLAGGRQRRVSSRDSLTLLGADHSASYAAIYASQPFVYALVNKLARGIGRLPIRTFEWIDEDVGEKRETKTSPLARLLHRPFPRGSRRQLVEALIGSVAVFGKGYAYKWRRAAGRPPEELWPIAPWLVTYRTGPDAPVAYYEIAVDGRKLVVQPEDMIHLQWWSPRGERGTSPLEPLRQSLTLEDAAVRHSIASFGNAIRPSGALVTPSKLDSKQRRELRAEIEDAYSGPDAAFRMLLLDGGLDWKAFSQTAADAQLLEQRKLGHVEACAVYDIPPPVVHILDRATFANITEQNVALYRESLDPWFGLVEGDFDSQLIADEPLFDGSVVEFDLRVVLRALIGERADAYVKLLSVYTPNELRAQEGLTPIDHPAADAILVPLNSAPVGPGFDLPEEPTAEQRQAAAMLVDALRSGNGKTEDARKLIERVLAAR